MQKSRQLFNYNASAVGVGGVLNGVVVPSVASVALSPSGGVGWAVVEDYNRNGVSFTRAESQVTGFRSDDVFTSCSRVSITNLALFGRLRVSFMRVVLTSTRDINEEGADDSRFDVETEYRGLEFDGEAIRPVTDDDVCRRRTFKDVAAKIQSDGVFGFDQKKEVRRALDEQRAPLQTSVIKGLESDGKVKGPGHILPVKGFGVLHLGELIVNQGHRRVSLLRVDLGVAGFKGGDVDSAKLGGSLRGTLTMGSSDTNGAPVWPRPGG